MVPLVHGQEYAADVLAVWSFARSFGPALQLHPFTLEDLCTALERDAPIRHSTRDAAAGRPLDDTPNPDEPPRIAPLLAELHLRLLRAVLRDVGQLRTTEQLPTPLEVSARVRDGVSVRVRVRDGVSVRVRVRDGVRVRLGLAEQLPTPLEVSLLPNPNTNPNPDPNLNPYLTLTLTVTLTLTLTLPLPLALTLTPSLSLTLTLARRASCSNCRRPRR